MLCPMCNSSTKIKDSRKFDDHVVRARKCEKCGYIIYTQETEINGQIARMKIQDRYNEYHRNQRKARKENKR